MNRALGMIGAGGWREATDLVAETQRDPAIGGTDSARADPHDIAVGAQLVEHRFAVAVDTRGQHVELEGGRGKRETLQARDRVDERVGPAPPRADSLPRGEEAREHRGFDGFDLASERSQGPAPQPAQDIDVAPLALGAARTEFAVHDPARTFEPEQRGADFVGGDAEAARKLG